MAEQSPQGRRHGMVTAQDVANAAGVSVTTVSRSFAKADLVTKNTRDRILKIAAELGYSPNIAARALAGRRSSLIGLLVNNFDDPENLDLFRFVSAEAQKRNYHAILLNIANERNELESVDTALRYQVDGLLVSATHLPDELVERCAAQNRPIVIVGRKSLRSGYSSVYCDNLAGAAQVADLFYAQGIRRPAFIGGKPEATVVKERMAGFVRRIEELYGFQPITRLAGGNDYEMGVATARELLDLPKPPDGFFCSSDLLAVALKDATVGHSGQPVRRQPLVVGFGRSMLSRLAAYDFLSVGMPFEAMVRSATSLLVEQITDGISEPREVVLPCEAPTA